MKTTIKISTATAILGLIGVAIFTKPGKLPVDGDTYTNWKITWKDSNGVVMKTFTSETATPLQNFGESNISYHWFGKPTFAMPPDENGNVCSWEMLK